MSSVLTMRETAAAVGLSYDRFRKVHRRMSADLRFPRPLHGCRWDAYAVAAWRAERSDPGRTEEPRALPAPSTPEARGARAWAQLERMRGA